MKSRFIILSLAVLLPLLAAAQTRFGYISYDAVLHEMPQYQQAQQNLLQLKATYEKEAKRSEDEFQRKFSEFLQGQKEFPQNIMQKRQAELQTLMERSVQFRQEVQDLLNNAERDMLAAVQQQLNAAVVAVGLEGGYAFVLNTDGNACPFISPAMGDDVTNLVRVKLGLLVIEETPAAMPENMEGPDNPTSPEQQSASAEASSDGQS